jgi:hypothetical protein
MLKDLIKEILLEELGAKKTDSKKENLSDLYVGKDVLVRTYSAGVHIGKVKWINPENANECILENSLRLWKWENGGLSLSAVANDGIKGGRLNRTGEIVLTNAIEYIPTTKKARESYEEYVEA